MSYSFATTPPPGLSMPLSLSASMDTLKSQYERMCEAETQRHVFVDVSGISRTPHLTHIAEDTTQHLIAQVTSLMQEKEDALRRLQRVEVGCDHYQKRLDEAQKSAENMQKAIVRSHSSCFLLETRRGSQAGFLGAVTTGIQ